jgi:hypothetical protein
MESGKRKTVCVSTCLAYFGIAPKNYHETGTVSNKGADVLRSHGYSVRSRLSWVGKGSSIASMREKVRKLDDPQSTNYIVTVWGSGWAHQMVINREGQTIIDTDSRKVDRRKIWEIYAVTPKEDMKRQKNFC